MKALRGLGGSELAWLWLDADARTRAAIDRGLRGARMAGPALRGDELIALGVPRGPLVGEVLEALREARVDGALGVGDSVVGLEAARGDREAETAFVRQWVRTHDPGSVMAKEG